jgi:hypothetical protein
MHMKKPHPDPYPGSSVAWRLTKQNLHTLTFGTPTVDGDFLTRFSDVLAGLRYSYKHPPVVPNGNEEEAVFTRVIAKLRRHSQTNRTYLVLSMYWFCRFRRPSSISVGFSLYRADDPQNPLATINLVPGIPCDCTNMSKPNQEIFWERTAELTGPQTNYFDTVHTGELALLETLLPKHGPYCS